MDPEDLPASDEELSLYMQLNYKPAIEIAEEEAINTILEENHYGDLRKRLDYDLTVLGIGVAKHEFLPAFRSRMSTPPISYTAIRRTRSSRTVSTGGRLRLCPSLS
jgi:hypothetical protein